jgi:esterase/lipase superfamily enzyme
MIHISCRAAVDNTTEFFADAPFVVLGEGLPARLRRKRTPRALIVVHGYKSAFDNTVEAYEQIEGEVNRIKPGEFPLIVGFHWPGSWSATFGYVAAERRAKEAGARLSELIQELVRRNFDVTVSAHSLGCKVALEALCVEDSPGFSLVLAGAAVDHDVFADKHRYMQAVRRRAYAVNVLYSLRDDVLKFGYRLPPQNWFSPALGWKGPKSTPSTNIIHAADLSESVAGHSEYRSVPEFYAHL